MTRYAVCVVLICAPLLGCGGSNASKDACLVLPLGIEAADPASPGQSRQAASVASCSQYLVVESVKAAAPAATAAPSYTVTLRNDASAPLDLSTVDLQGYYSAGSKVDGGSTRACAAALSGMLRPGSTTDVVMRCSAEPGAGESYLVVRVNQNDASFPLPM